MKHLLFFITILISFAAHAENETAAIVTNNSTENANYRNDTMAISERYSNMIEQTYYIKNSKLHQYKNGQLRPIKTTIKLKNDAMLSPLGVLKMNDGNSTQLKNGDAIEKDGTVTKYK